MKDIFSYNTDIEKNAYMNWATDKDCNRKNMIVMADGYRDASLLLVEDILKDNNDKKADKLIFPVLFNANHSIELYLKAINWSLNILLDNGKQNEGNHNIQQIYQNVCSRFNEFENDKEERKKFKSLTKNLEKYIDELYPQIEKISYEKDKMDFTRYPITNNYIHHFYIDQLDNVVIDLENFFERFGEMGKSLSNIAKYYLNKELLKDE